MPEVMKSRSSTGCVFEYAGIIPPFAYNASHLSHPIEQAVYDNDVERLRSLTQEGHTISGNLKIGQMSCIEYAAMKGNLDMLIILVENCDNITTLRKYFALDVVEQAYMISHNKKQFFDNGALSDAFKMEAALYTAVQYNHPHCVNYLLRFMGLRNIRRHSFVIMGHRRKSMSPLDLAEARGHAECMQIIRNHLEQSAVQP